MSLRQMALLALIGGTALSCQEEDASPVQGGKEPDESGRPQRAVAPAKTEDGPSEPEPSRVDLSGKSAALSVAEVKGGPRVYARHLRTWIYETPSRKSRKLGYMRAGASSPTDAEPRTKAGCKGGWYPVEPKGFVCVGKRATLNHDDPVVQFFEANPPRADQRLPYRYGTVRRPGPIFGQLPKKAELDKVEPGFEARYPEWLDAKGEIGASFRQGVWDWGKTPPDPKQAWESGLSKGVPALLAAGKYLPSPLGRPRPRTTVMDRMDPRVGHAFLETFFSEGRRYGITTHLELVPLDRYRPIEGSSFHGVEIGKDIDFPFAFVRRVGSKFADGSKAEYRDVLQLTGKRKFVGKSLHYETVEGKYISDQYASELRLAKKMPAWAKKGEKWMSISISKQTLVLYEGTKPVFATLVSTGEAGLADHEKTTATKRGWFRVHTKHVTATMASDVVGEEFELRDVPYVQYFAQGGYALHGAYWHDRFGTPKSHGCINLSPEDARRIFHWTDPPVPTGWHGALLPLKGTVVFIHS